MQGRAWLTGLLVLALGGCVSMARDPAGAVLGPDFAEVTFRLGIEDTVGLGSATVQEYRIGPGRDRAQARTARIFTWAHKDPRSLLLPAGQRVHVFAELRGYWGAPGISHNGSDTCLNMSAFTPQPGARYDVMQVGEAAVTCRLQIVDLATGTPPQDLEIGTFLPDGSPAP